MAPCRECDRGCPAGAHGAAALGRGRWTPGGSWKPDSRIHSAGPAPDTPDRGCRRGNRGARPQAAGSFNGDVSAAAPQGAGAGRFGNGRRVRMHLPSLRFMDVRHGRTRGWRHRGDRPSGMDLRVGHGTGVRSLGTAHGLEQLAIAGWQGDLLGWCGRARRARIVGIPRRTAAPAVRSVGAAGERGAGHADLRGDRGPRRAAVLVRVHAGDGSAAGRLPALGAASAAGHPPVHTGRLHPGRGRSQSTLGPRILDLARLAARRPGGHHHSSVRLLHIVYGRFRSHDSLTRRADPAGAGQIALFAGLLAGPDDSFGIHRAAIPAQPGGHPLRRLLENTAQRAVPWRVDSRLPASRAGGRMGRAPRARRRARAAQVRVGPGARSDARGQVGAAAAAGRDRWHLQRHRDLSRSRGGDGSVRFRG